MLNSDHELYNIRRKYLYKTAATAAIALFIICGHYGGFTEIEFNR